MKTVISPDTANWTMMENIDNLFENKTHQRGVMLIDRRKSSYIDQEYYKTLMIQGWIKIHAESIYIPSEVYDIIFVYFCKKPDTFYCYQCRKTNGKRNCHSITKDKNKLLSGVSLIDMSRHCLVPYYSQKDGCRDIGFLQNRRDILTLSFHCFSAEEIRVYLYYQGCGTRFFIEDIEHYLPSLVFCNLSDIELEM